MSGPVDVLTVMQASADQLWRYRRDILARDEEQARAAVAELIEADSEYDEATAAAGGFIEDAYEEDSYGVHGSEFYRCLACEAESGAGLLNKGVTHETDCVRNRYEVAIQRRRAALARCGGAA